jgi:hypothetical protein
MSGMMTDFEFNAWKICFGMSEAKRDPFEILLLDNTEKKERWGMIKTDEQTVGNREVDFRQMFPEVKWKITKQKLHQGKK